MNTIRYIRTVVLLGMTQSAFADEIGSRQATVSRWERDGNNIRPDIADLAAIRALVVKRGHPWSDEWFFKAPSAASKGEAA